MKTPLPPPTFSAVPLQSLRALIFDMDGTLTDSDPVHLVAFEQMLAPFGLPMNEEIFRAKISGRTNAEIARLLFPDWPVERQRRFADEKEALFREMSARLEPLSGLVTLLDFAEERELGLALVTNAPRANAEHMLAALALANRFPVTVLGEEVERPKPDPMPYRLALKRLGIGPDEAIAFEDSVPRIRAAAGAGLLTIGIATSQDEDVLYAAGAERVVADFTDPGLWQFLRTAAPGA